MKNNKFVLGEPGTGKTQLLTKLLNAADLKNTVVFICGHLENPNLDFGNLDNAEVCTIISSIEGLRSKRESDTDLRCLEIEKEKFPDKEILVIIDEAHAPADSLIAQILEDVKTGKITLWLAAQSFITLSQYWNPSVLNYFEEFYFFHSRLNEDFLNQSTINMIENLQRGNENYIHFAVTPEKPIKNFFSEQLQNLLKKEVDGIGF